MVAQSQFPGNFPAPCRDVLWGTRQGDGDLVWVTVWSYVQDMLFALVGAMDRVVRHRCPAPGAN